MTILNILYWLMYSADGINDDQDDTIGKFIQNLVKLSWQRIRYATHAQKSFNDRFYSSKNPFCSIGILLEGIQQIIKADGLLKLCHVM